MKTKLPPAAIALSLAALAMLPVSAQEPPPSEDQEPILKVGELPVESRLELVGRMRFPTLSELEAALDGEQRDKPIFVCRLASADTNVYAPRWAPGPGETAIAYQRADIKKQQSKVYLKDSIEARGKPLIDDDYSYEGMLIWAQGAVPGRRAGYGLVSNVSGATQVHLGHIGGKEPPELSSGGKSKRHPAIALSAPGTGQLVFDLGKKLVALDIRGFDPVSGKYKIDQFQNKTLGFGTQARWSPDGKQLVYVKEIYGEGEQRDKVVRQEIAILAYKLTAPVLVHAGEAGQILRSPCFSPDGSQVAYYLRRAGVDPVWELWTRDIRSQLNKPIKLLDQVVIEPIFEHVGPAWSSDSKRLYAFSQTTRDEEYYPLLWLQSDGKRQGKIDYDQSINVANDLHARSWAGGDLVAFTGINRGPRELYVAVTVHPRMAKPRKTKPLKTPGAGK